MSFGLSGAVDRSQMMGADVAVAYMDGFRGYATDYNITALSPVSMIPAVEQLFEVIRNKFIFKLERLY